MRSVRAVVDDQIVRPFEAHVAMAERVQRFGGRDARHQAQPAQPRQPAAEAAARPRGTGARPAARPRCARDARVRPSGVRPARRRPRAKACCDAAVRCWSNRSSRRPRGCRVASRAARRHGRLNAPSRIEQVQRLFAAHSRSRRARRSPRPRRARPRSASRSRPGWCPPRGPGHRRWPGRRRAGRGVRRSSMRRRMPGSGRRRRLWTSRRPPSSGCNFLRGSCIHAIVRGLPPGHAPPPAPGSATMSRTAFCLLMLCAFASSGVAARDIAPGRPRAAAAATASSAPTRNRSRGRRSHAEVARRPSRAHRSLRTPAQAGQGHAVPRAAIRRFAPAGAALAQLPAGHVPLSYR